MEDELRLALVAPVGEDPVGGQQKAGSDLLRSVEALGCPTFLIEVPEPGLFPSRLLGSLRMAAKMLQARFSFRANVLHVFTPTHSRGLLEKLLLTTLGRALGLKTLLNPRNTFETSHWSMAERRVLPFLMKLNNAIVCQSRAVSRFMVEEFGINEGMIHVVYNGIAPNEIPVSIGSGDGVRFLFVGQVCKRKGVDSLVEALGWAAETSRSWTIDICGPLPPSGAAAFLDPEAEKNIQARVRFRGPVFGRTKCEVFQGADAFLLPSRAEGFPNALLEAMLGGLPVITSRVGAIPEMLGGQGGILVDPESPQEICAAMMRLSSDKRLRAEMGRANRQRALEIFGLEKVASDFVETFNKVLRQ